MFCDFDEGLVVLGYVLLIKFVFVLYKIICD